MIESVRRARQEVLRKRREAAAAAAAAERAERERAEREAKERARAHEEAKKARRKEVVQELISRDAQLETSVLSLPPVLLSLLLSVCLLASASPSLSHLFFFTTFTTFPLKIHTLELT